MYLYKSCFWIKKRFFLLLGIGAIALSQCDADKKQEPFTLRIRIPSEATTFNPLLPMPGYSRFVSSDIFTTLGGINPKTLALENMLVKKIPTARIVSEGPNQGALAYDFEIWDEAVWDDGKPITAEDVVFSLKLIFHPMLPTKPWRGYFEQLQEVSTSADSPKKFTVFLKDYYILGLESLCQFPIYPAHRYDPEGALKEVSLSALFREPEANQWAMSDSVRQKTFTNFFTSDKAINDPAFVMGPGPYKLVSIIPGEGTVLEKKTDWWGDKIKGKNELLNGFPARIEYRVLKDEGAVETNLRNNQLDLTTSLAMEKYMELSKDPALAAQYHFQTVPFLGYSYWLLNNRNPKFSDVRVRQALAHLLDYDRLIAEVHGGSAKRSVSPIYYEKSYFNKKIKPYPFDLSATKGLLEQAGWSDSNGDGILDKVIDGKNTKFTLNIKTSNKTEASRLTGELVLAACQKAGIAAEVSWEDITNITKETKSGEYETALLAAAQFSGLDDLYQNFHSASLSPNGDNRSGYASPEADRLIEAIRVEADEKKRTALYHQLQERIHTDVPVVFLVSPQERCIASKRFTPVFSANRPNYYPGLFQLAE